MLWVKREFTNGSFEFVPHEGSPLPGIQYFHKRLEPRSQLEFFVPIATVLDMVHHSDPEILQRMNSKAKTHEFVVVGEDFDFGSYRIGHLIVTIAGIFCPLVFLVGFPIFFTLLNIKMVKSRILTFRTYRKALMKYTALGWLAWSLLVASCIGIFIGMQFDNVPILVAVYVVSPTAIGLVIVLAIWGAQWIKGPCCGCYDYYQ